MTLEIKPLRHRGRWVAATLVLLFAAVTLNGIVVTLYLTVLAMFIGLFGGILLAVMRISDNPVLTSVARFFIWFFRVDLCARGHWAPPGRLARIGYEAELLGWGLYIVDHVNDASKSRE